MNRKIIIGSIIAVAILIGISLTSVVGYRGVDSNVKDSPLFNIRTSRATGKISGDFTCNYDKNKKCALLCPLENNRAILFRKVIDNICKMDDNTYNKFISSVIKYTQEDNSFKSLNPDDINEAFFQLRNDDISIIVCDNNKNTKPATMMPTMCYTCPRFCYFEEFIKMIIEKILEFVDWCFHLYTGSMVLTACCNPPHTYLKGCPKTFRQLF